MTRLPFTMTHNGCSALLALQIDSHFAVKLIEFVALKDNQAAPMVDRDAFADRVRTNVEFLNDLMAADMPFEALATCRRSPGLFGAILDPAVCELEAVRGAPQGGADAS